MISLGRTIPPQRPRSSTSLRSAVRVNDWLHNVPTQLTRDLIAKKGPRLAAVVDLTPAERLRLVYELVTGDESSEGQGLGLRVGKDGIEAIMGLHDQNFNKVCERVGGSECHDSSLNLMTG